MRSGLARIVNALTEGFNKKDRLPTYIVLIIDRDMIKFMNFFNYGINQMLRDGLHYISRQLQRMIHTRMEDLTSKRPGAILASPRIIWVKMINRPKMDFHPEGTFNNTIALRAKFNDMIDEVIPAYEKTHVVSISSVMDNVVQNFTSLGELTPAGKSVYWKELDHHCKKIDRTPYKK